MGQKTLLESISEGTLLETEYSSAAVARATAMTAHERDLQTARLRAAGARTANISQGASDPAALQGMAVFIEPGSRNADCEVVVDVCVRRLHLCVQAQRAEADIFVVRDPGNLPPCTRVALLIRGGWACDHSYLASGGSRGCLLHVSRMWRARRRELWVSLKFKGKQSRVWAEIEKMLPHNTSLREIGSATLAERTAACAAQSRQTDTIGLVTNAQKDKGPFRELHCVCTLDSLWHHFSSADQLQGATGVCGL